MSAGSVTLTAAPGWSTPWRTSGYAGATPPPPLGLSFDGQVITVSGVTLTSGSTLTITYGSGGGPRLRHRPLGFSDSALYHPGEVHFFGHSHQPGQLAGCDGGLPRIRTPRLAVVAGMPGYRGLPGGQARHSSVPICPWASPSTPPGTCSSPTGPTAWSKRSRRLGLSRSWPGCPVTAATQPPAQRRSRIRALPEGVAVNAAGDLYIADAGAGLVEKVTPAGTLSVAAGLAGQSGAPTPGPATSSKLGVPSGVAVDSAGDSDISDWGEDVVEKVTPGGTLSVVAGVAWYPQHPNAGASDELGLGASVRCGGRPGWDFYIADADNEVIEKVTSSGTLSVAAGGRETTASRPPGPATSSYLSAPKAVPVDDAGDLYIADSVNQVIEEVTPAGTLSVVAGVPGSGTYPTPGPATSSHLEYPADVAVSPTGNFYIADHSNNAIEEVFGVASRQDAPQYLTLAGGAYMPDESFGGGSHAIKCPCQNPVVKRKGIDPGTGDVVETPRTSRSPGRACPSGWRAPMTRAGPVPSHGRDGARAPRARAGPTTWA